MTKPMVSLTLDEDVINALDEKAKKEERSRSMMANILLRNSLQ